MTSRSAADREKWNELYASGARPDRPPSAWVISVVRRLPNELSLVDIAGGTGRHAVPIARNGRGVTLVDISTLAVATALATERSLSGVVADAAMLPFAPESFGCVTVVNFLDREIFDTLCNLLTPGGFLVYETYTRPHLDLVGRGLARGPNSPQYLLEPGELPELARPLDVIEYSEGDFSDDAGRRYCAQLLAQKP